MRLTVRLDPEIYAAAKALAAEREIGIGEAVNELAHRGLSVNSTPKAFTMPTRSLGKAVACTKTGELLDHLDEIDGVYDRYRVNDFRKESAS